MLCPRCRKEIEADAVTHECGWRRAVPALARVAAPKSDLAVARAAIEAAQELLSRGTVRKREMVAALSDVGHGDCACEVCCAERARRREKAAWLRARFPVSP